MLDWLRENVQLLAAFGGLVFGLIGTGLSIWNRVEQSHEARRKREGELPRGNLKVYGPAPREPGWRFVEVKFTNPRHNRLHITSARLLRPTDAVIAIAEKNAQGSLTFDPTAASREVVLDWIVLAATDEPATTQGRLFVGTPQLGNEHTGNRSTEFAIEFRGDEISIKRRPVKIVATTIVKDGA